MRMRLFLKLSAWSICVLTLTNLSAVAQNSPATAPKEQNREIVVEADRLPPRKAPPPPGITIQSDRQVNRVLDEKAQMFVRCAPFFPPKILRRVIDGQPNTPKALLAMDSFIRANMACWPDLPAAPTPPPPTLASCWQAYTVADIPVCRSNYDRGAILEAAIMRFAPDAKLTVQDVDDLAVMARLKVSEEIRLQHAYSDERVRAHVAQCLARSEPDETTRLVHAHGDALLQTQYVYRILDHAKHCLGNPERVEVEPLYFRYVLIDAFYRWVVAARHVDTLFPT